MRLGALVILLPLLLSGCAGSHYYQEKDGVVSFYFRQPEATEVLLACSLDHFQPHPAARDWDGTWKVEILASNDFRYFYLVDGEVVAPECPLSETDDFGARNCLYGEQRGPRDAPLGQEHKSAAAADGSD
ncbi:MAG: glycogen-binding domain-containing protein [Desulfobulbaceae bacterium]